MIYMKNPSISKFEGRKSVLGLNCPKSKTKHVPNCPKILPKNVLTS